MHVIHCQAGKSGGSVVDNMLDYESRSRKFYPSLLRLFGWDFKLGPISVWPSFWWNVKPLWPELHVQFIIFLKHLGPVSKLTHLLVNKTLHCCIFFDKTSGELTFFSSDIINVFGFICWRHIHTSLTSTLTTPTPYCLNKLGLVVQNSGPLGEPLKAFIFHEIL